MSVLLLPGISSLPVPMEFLSGMRVWAILNQAVSLREIS
jgi:hypothetical protein